MGIERPTARGGSNIKDGVAWLDDVVGFLDFLQFVDERYSRKEECLKNGFPADPAPNIICDKCDFFDLCTRSGLDVNGEGDMDE